MLISQPLLVKLLDPPPVQPFEFRVEYTGTREKFDSMTSDQLMNQVKQHMDIKKNTDFWNKMPEYRESYRICCEILKSRGIEVTSKLMDA